MVHPGEKTLLLLTNYFPYKKGEEYLETELPYLSRAFDHIVIIAGMVGEGEAISRKLPANAEAYPIGLSHSLGSKLSMVFRCGPSAWKRARQLSSPSEYSRFIQKLYAAYFEARAESVYQQAVKILDQAQIKEAGGLVIYSYWLYQTAKLAVELRQHYFQDPSIYTFSRAHRYDVDEEHSPLKFLPFRPYLLEHLDQVFPVSSYHADFLQEKYPAYADKVTVRRLGVYPVSGEEKPYRLPVEGKTVISVSSFKKVKRVDKIIEALSEAFPRLEALSPSWVHFGGGKEEESYKRQAGQKMPEGSCHFYGHISHDKLMAYYRDHKPCLFINLSESEGVPVSIMEACSYGVPIVATAAGGTAELVVEGENGHLLAVDASPSEAARAVEEILTAGPKCYNEYCRKSYLLWDEKYNAGKVYPAFAEEIRSKIG